MNFTYNIPISSFWRTAFVRFVSVLFLSVFCCCTAQAQSWADSMFTIKSHDFGSVPLLSDTQYSFKFHNTSKQDVHIASVSSSCTCTDASAPVRTIKSGEKGEIIAKVNTSGQRQKKNSATITVTFDKPSTAHVQLEVAVYIRPDIVLNPGSIDFGTIREGQKITKTVQLLYAGNPNWGLVRIDRANKNPYIHARAESVDNPANSREITYNIQITLSDKTPPGYVREILRFVTNDQNSVAIELPVSGFVMDALVAKPSPFQFGSIAPGETVTKYLVLRASQPFRIRSVKCPEDRRFVFSPSDQSSSVHIVAVTLTSKQENAEKVAKTIIVETTLKDQGKLQIPIYAHFLSSDDVNSQEYYAPQWKSLILEAQNSGFAEAPADERQISISSEKKPRQLKSIGNRSEEEWEELPVDVTTLAKITTNEQQNDESSEDEEPAESLHLDFPPTGDQEEPSKTIDATQEEELQEDESGIPIPQASQDIRENSSMFPDEGPLHTKNDDLNTQDWVPTAKKQGIVDDESLSEAHDFTNIETETKSENNKSDWRPSVASNALRRSPAKSAQLPQPSSPTPKASGKARFGIPQKSLVPEESDSPVNQNNQNEINDISTVAPKKVVAKPLPMKSLSEMKPKVTSRQETPENY